MSEINNGFTGVTPLRNINDAEGRRLFNDGQSYPIDTTYQRGNYIVDDNPVYFAQTTLVVINETGERTYIPYSSGNFSKQRSVRAAEEAAV